MGKRKSKCIAAPRWAGFCDGCNSNSTKCPYRYKYRELRNAKKGELLYRRQREEMEHGYE